jgi:hypothetical protein
MKPYISELFGEEVLFAGEFSRHGAVGDPPQAVYTDNELILIKRWDNQTKRTINHAKKLFNGRLIK